MTDRAFTFKSILAGFIGIAWIAAGSALVDDMVQRTSYVTGNFTPIGATAYILFFVLAWNPFFLGLLGRWRKMSWARRWGFGVRELALVFALSYTACWVPASGLYRYFHTQITMPWLHSTTAYAHWEPILEASFPEKLFPRGLAGRHPDAPPEERLIWERTYLALPGGDPSLQNAGVAGLWQWPWRDWLGALGYWGPLLMAFAVTTVALLATVHRQWSRHEQIPYPLGRVYADLLERDGRRILPPVYHEKLFWGAFIFVFMLHTWNWTSLWWPNYFPAIQLDWWIHSWHIIPEVHQAGVLWNYGRIVFAIIGLSYFISGEAGLTLGLSQFLMLAVAYPFYRTTGMAISGDAWHGTRLGGYLAYMILLLYAGRHWYWRIFAKALGRGRANGEDRDSVWGARLFMAAFTVSWVLLCAMEMDPFLAALYLTFLHGTLLVYARLICEAGIPFMQMGEVYIPLVRALGYGAAGVKGSLYISHLHMVFSQNHREALSPYTAQALLVGERAGIPLRRLGLALCLGLALALAAGFWARAYGFYRHGTAREYHGHISVPEQTMHLALAADRAARAGQAPAEEPYGLAKIRAIRPERGTLLPIAVGLGITFALAALRYRYSWFMLHPLLCLVVGTYPMWVTSQCFLIGWAIKSLILHFGGGMVYQKGKPFFVGMIAGEAAMLGLNLVFAIVYYASTDKSPETLWVHPI